MPVALVLPGDRTRVGPVADECDRLAQARRFAAVEALDALVQPGERHPGPGIGRVRDGGHPHERIAHRDEVVEFQQLPEMAEQRCAVGEGQTEANQAAHPRIADRVPDDAWTAGRPGQSAHGHVKRLVGEGGGEFERPQPRRREMAEHGARAEDREERLRSLEQPEIGAGDADAAKRRNKVAAAEAVPRHRSRNRSVTGGPCDSELRAASDGSIRVQSAG